MVLACFAMLSTWCKAHVSFGPGPTLRKHVELISLICKWTAVLDLLIDEIKALLHVNVSWGADEVHGVDTLGFQRSPAHYYKCLQKLKHAACQYCCSNALC